MTKPFFKCTPFNFVPLTRTPWAGAQIAQLKRKFFPNSINEIPELIGESWEVSTDTQFPSQIFMDEKNHKPLNELLKENASFILGQNNFMQYGAHFPLLLKWLEANDLLSVQLHPSNSHPMLKANECGKPEAWFVINVENSGYVYLGFQENLSQNEIVQCLKNDELEKCLYKYYPKPFDYISVPPGCVHAIGPGVLVAEPQYVLPNKIAKTWRLSDWKRLYDEHGKKSPTGKPRELHGEESFSAINWNLPRGKNLEKLLILNMALKSEFLGNENNPFALKLFYGPGAFYYSHLIPNSFSLFTVWSGALTLTANDQVLRVQGGESGFVCAGTGGVQLNLDKEASIAFFALSSFF